MITPGLREKSAHMGRFPPKMPSNRDQIDTFAGIRENSTWHFDYFRSLLKKAAAFFAKDQK